MHADLGVICRDGPAQRALALLADAVARTWRWPTTSVFKRCASSLSSSKAVDPDAGGDPFLDLFVLTKTSLGMTIPTMREGTLLSSAIGGIGRGDRCHLPSPRRPRQSRSRRLPHDAVCALAGGRGGGIPASGETYCEGQKGSEAFAALSKLFADVVRIMEETRADLLGDIFQGAITEASPVSSHA